ARQATTMLNKQQSPTTKTTLLSALRPANISKVLVKDGITAADTASIKQDLDKFVRGAGNTKTVSVIFVEGRD
ncbi:MAG: hypothetical protein QGF16_14640, partial [Rhodospirillales bacterium]|nr:hypothetical protein [Rhodospirillales bacterium]